jgi:glutamine amidotransferase
MIAIIDYGTGNVMSILNMLSFIGVQAKVINNPKDISTATKLILPGVGSFDNAMNQIKNKWQEELHTHALIKKKYILGICLGMQLMCNKSEEGSMDGLGWIDGIVNKFQFSHSDFKIPHMGWNYVQTKKENPLLDIDELNRFYFVHSYHVLLSNINDELCETSYGYNFTSAFNKNNIFGVQFHPEKSHKYGFSLLKKFANL